MHICVSSGVTWVWRIVPKWYILIMYLFNFYLTLLVVTSANFSQFSENASETSYAPLTTEYEYIPPICIFTVILKLADTYIHIDREKETNASFSVLKHHIYIYNIKTHKKYGMFNRYVWKCYAQIIHSNCILCTFFSYIIRTIDVHTIMFY